MAKSTDRSLIDDCLRGQHEAWNELVERYSRLVWSIARKHRLLDADAEDVHQTVFANLIRHLGDLRERERLSSWLITTATRECWRLQKRQSRGAISLNDQRDELAASESKDASDEQLVRDAMTRLNARCQELLTALFRAVGEPSYPEIAERLGMPTGSIGPTRARCLARLEALLRELGLGLN